MARRSKPIRRRSRMRRRGRRGAIVAHHVIPLALAGAGLATIFTTPDSNGNSFLSNAATILKDPQNADPAAIQGLPGQIINGVLSGGWVVPVIGAVGVAWAGRKFGLSRATRLTKKVSLL